MGVSITPMYDAGASPTGRLTKRQQCELARGQMEAERSSFFPLWLDLNKFILPRRARFQAYDVNKGDRRNLNIIDSTATKSSGVLSAGMMSGITSPARPWFLIGTSDPQVAEQADVKVWLHTVRDIIAAVFLRSNLYNKLPTLYTDVGTFGTGAMAVLEDEETVIRCYDFPVGTFAIANDAKLRVRTFSRVFRRTVQQVVEQWGNIDPQTGKPDFIDHPLASTISLSVQQRWRNNGQQTWVDLVHIIQPNVSYSADKINPKYKRYEELYYELGVQNQGLTDQSSILSHSGFDDFPVLVARWETNSEDVYGTNSPGITVIGDVKQLQLGEKRAAQAFEKYINPAMTGPTGLRSVKTSLLAGDITFFDDPQGKLGFRPTHELNNIGPALQASSARQNEVRERIKDGYFVNLILMMSESDRRDITAREIDERHEEKMLAIGPVLEQLNQDVLDPLIIRTFNICLRRGMLPPPPPAMQNQPLRIEYVSVMAQAQKQIALAAIERYAGFVAQYAQIDPDALDGVDSDELIKQYGDASGIPPTIMRAPDAIAAVRQQKQQAAAQQQAAQNAPGVAKAAKDASQAQTGDGANVLQLLLNKQNARRTIGATSAPPASVIP